MRIQYTTLLLFCVFSISCLTCIHAKGDPKELNEKASTYYREGHYNESLSIWYQLVKSGNTDPNLYFNIGNAESILGHIPEAILAFEMALRSKPADKEFAAAIKGERNKLENPVIPVPPFFLTEWVLFGLALLRPGEWAMMGLLFFLGALIQWLIHIKVIRAVRFRHSKYHWLLIVSGISCILIGFLSYHQLYRKDEAIVMVNCDCMQAPAAASPTIRKLEAGEKVRIKDQVTSWKKVSLLNLDEGWINRDCLTLIEVGK